MKYMGSKTAMLSNGLGHEILKHGRRAERVVDLFSGSGALSWFAAENLDKPVLALDLQNYAVVFAKAVLQRTGPVDVERAVATWLTPIERKLPKSRRWLDGVSPNGHLTKADVHAARRACELGPGLIWKAYGGYYFSPRQALALDAMLSALPVRAPLRSVCHAALIMAASKCAAAPGHTAQPFAPTERGLPVIRTFWSIDAIEAAKTALEHLGSKHARVRGAAKRAEAVAAAKELLESDLVLVDPPYSAVQYSRFYHVFEALAEARDFVPFGAGRYPPWESRPRSDFSVVTRSSSAMALLFANLAEVGCTAIVTFPSGASSNGLSGDDVLSLAREHFRVRSHEVRGRFSTLGGNNRQRPARSRSDELIVVLSPKSR